ncbi:ribosomal protein S18-alanine N-acetyltransferase [Desulfitispora alkaliphila]|uniref:ribosomal protein S18-alanine N-acetyltransferase n=1 Tax=Desulfitispora alkaliphila TaxID=622674 RepID=UPI003D245370
MKLDHVQQVLAIEQESFPTPWSEKAFKGELKDNDFARYYVCVQAAGLEGGTDKVIGYVGMWLVIDEAHITTIAVDPGARSAGVGQFMLINIFREAISLGIKKMTLEVRPSNSAALSLYKKLGFEPKGIRHRYYSDNGEDAIIMWKELV